MEAFIDNAVPWIAHIILLVACIAGCVGSLIPAVPGGVIILVGSVIHGAMTGWDPLGLWIQGGLLALVVVANAAQWGISALGAKKYGASNWGIAGAMVGMLLGLFIPVPIAGPFVGAFLGALAVEWSIAKKEGGDAARAGFGAVLGAVVGLMAEFGAAVVMVGVIVVAFVS